MVIGIPAALLVAGITYNEHRDAQIAAQYYTIPASDVTEVLAYYPFRTDGESFAVTAKGDTVTFNSHGCYDSLYGTRSLSHSWLTDSIKVRPAHLKKYYEKNSTAFRWDWK